MLRSSLRHAPVNHHSLKGYVQPVLGLRWYLSLSFGAHIIVIGLSVLYFAFLPAPTAKTLPVPLMVSALPLPLPQPAQETREEPPPLQRDLPKPAVPDAIVRKASHKPVRKPTHKPKEIPVAAPQPPPRLVDEQVASYYPDAYVSKQLNGDVTLRLFVDPGTGKVLGVRVEIPSPYPLFNEAAKEAVTALMPSVNTPVPAEVFLPVRFRYSR